MQGGTTQPTPRHRGGRGGTTKAHTRTTPHHREVGSNPQPHHTTPQGGEGSNPQPQGGGWGEPLGGEGGGDGRTGIIYGHALRGPPPPSPPLHGLWSRMPPLLWDGVWVPSSLFGSLGLTVYVWFRPKACIHAGFIGLGLVWGLKLRSRLINAGAGATALRYRIYGLRRACVLCWHMLALSVTPGRFSSCSSDGPHPSPHTHASAPPSPVPDHIIGAGGAGNARRLTIYGAQVWLECT